MGSSVSRSRWANVLGFASVLTTAVGVAMAVDGGPGSGNPRQWDCTGAGCTTPPNDYRSCTASQEACCCYNSSTHTHSSSCYPMSGNCNNQSNCQLCT